MKGNAARLGQHFLRSDAAIAAMVDVSGAKTGVTVLEIGPGEGVLTAALLKGGAHVVAVEKDSRLFSDLQKRFADEIARGQLQLVEADFRDFDLATLSGPYHVAANIPYYITGEIIRSLLTAKHQPSKVTLLIQKEVADRIVAQDGKESILSLSVKAYGVPRIVRKVPRGSFSPMPAVDSAILCIDSVSREFFKSIDEQTFFTVVKSGFAEKRKQLGGNLRAIASPEEVANAFAVCGLDATVRAEDVALDRWGCLAKNFSRLANN